MGRKSIVIDEAIPELRERLEERFNVIALPGNAITATEIRNADALIVRTRTKCDRALLEGSKVKIVATATIGMDHINISELSALGIETDNAPGCNAPAVAQYVWSGLLSRGFDPSRDRLGIVGKGHVGTIVAEWGRRLGGEDTVMVCDPPRAEAGYKDEKYYDLEEIATTCDAITFHVPLTTDGAHPTLGMGSEEMLRKMKSGSIVINASRGGVVYERALIDAIQMRGIRAIIDTWEGEPRINKTLLEAAEIATPHIAGYSKEGKSRATRMVLAAIERHFGVTLSKEGLAEPYTALLDLNREIILQSYDPMGDTKRLKEHPEEFEAQRNGYRLRREIIK